MNISFSFSWHHRCELVLFFFSFSKRKEESHFYILFFNFSFLTLSEFAPPTALCTSTRIRTLADSFGDYHATVTSYRHFRGRSKIRTCTIAASTQCSTIGAIRPSFVTDILIDSCFLIIEFIYNQTILLLSPAEDPNFFLSICSRMHTPCLPAHRTL